MSPSLLAAAVRLALATLLLASSGLVHCEEDAFSKWATAHAVPLTTLKSNEDFSDLLPLKSAIGPVRVVALGEPTHGAHEPLAFRNRLIRFLVEEMGFTAIALESGFTESAITDAFVAGGPGEMQNVLSNGLSSGSGRYGENRELIQWIRDYNTAARVAGHHTIRFYGIDLTAGGRISGTKLAIDDALAYLSRANPADTDSIRLSLDDSLPSNDWRWGPLSQSALGALDRTIPKIAKALAKNRKLLIEHSSAEEYRWALHNLDVAAQLAQCAHVTTPKSFEDMKYSGPVMGCRDQAMAENVRWIVENEGPKGRVLVFAANAHVMNSVLDGGIWAPMQEKPRMMGWHLRRAFGNDLLIITTSSATGAALLGKWTPVEGSIDNVLSQLGPPKLFLDLRMARQDAAALAWLSTPHPLRTAIDTFVLITPSTAIDALIYLDELTPATHSAAQAP